MDSRLVFRSLLSLDSSTKGEVQVLCPFHSDSEPSLSVNLDRGVFFCHGGCEEPRGGGPVEFYAKWYKIPVEEARKRLLITRSRTTLSVKDRLRHLEAHNLKRFVSLVSTRYGVRFWACVDWIKTNGQRLKEDPEDQSVWVGLKQSVQDMEMWDQYLDIITPYLSDRVINRGLGGDSDSLIWLMGHLKSLGVWNPLRSFDPTHGRGEDTNSLTDRNGVSICQERSPVQIRRPLVTTMGKTPLR